MPILNPISIANAVSDAKNKPFMKVKSDVNKIEDTTGNNSKGFFATNGSVNIVAKKIVQWKITENNIP